ncbi:hypothetical protein M0R04_12480 [Candidatus Dojkabacteria bacterium]|jgi:hypothetical protein|nr:hypothetical protein [Candidatus Dojkabacteria bacterium]
MSLTVRLVELSGLIKDMRKGINIAEKNGNWKGDRVGYKALHSWVRRRLLEPSICESCKLEKSLDLANISGEYKRRLDDWRWLCRSCHIKSDGRINNLKIGSEKNGEYRNCLVCKKVIYKSKYRIKNGEGKYCSYTCTNKGRWKGLSKGKIGTVKTATWED